LLRQNTMKRSAFRLIYRSILRGLPGIGTPYEVADRALARSSDLEGAATDVVRLHTTLGASQGFVFGLPGWLLLPVTLPANLASAAAVQLHMTASLAALAGNRLESPDVRERCVSCLLRAGPAEDSDTEEEEIARRAGGKLMERGARWAIDRTVKRVAKTALRRIGVRSMPLVGGLIGGGADGWRTQTVADCARVEFLPPAGRAPVDPAGSAEHHPR